MRLKVIYNFAFLFYSTPLMAQSPFDYGKSEKIYFISKEERLALEIEYIYEINQKQEGKEGIKDNWEVTEFAFVNDVITVDWSPYTLPENYKFDYDNLTENLNVVNGSRYEFKEGKLVSHGGTGYGTFDWTEIDRISDSVSIGKKSCVGHCGSFLFTYSKNVYNDNQLLYSVIFPPSENEIETANDNSEITYNDYQQFFSKLNAHHSNDTITYIYNRNGLFLYEKNKKERSNFKTPLKFTDTFPDYNFHQCYISGVKMEKYFKTKLGIIPQTILIEIYEQGIFSFSINPKDKKYYVTKTILLEK
jgi:hypothetical protein